MKPQLNYINHPLLALRYFEWVAVERLYAQPKGQKMTHLYPHVTFRIWMNEHQRLVANVRRDAKVNHAWIATDIAKIGTSEELENLEKVYAHLDTKLKIQNRDLTAKTDQTKAKRPSHPPASLGPALDEKSSLVVAAKAMCQVIAAQNGSSKALVQTLINEEATKLEQLYCEEGLTEAERNALISTIMRPLVHELMTTNNVERKLLDEKQKQAYFLWGHIKAKHAVGEEFELDLSTYKKWCGGDSNAYKVNVEILEKLKAIRVVKSKKADASVKKNLVKRLL